MKISTLSLIVMAIVATSSVGRTSADATKRRCRHRPTSTATVTSTVSPSPTHFKFAAAAEETTSTVPHSSPHPSSSVPASSTIIQPRPIHTSNTPQGSSAGLSADQQGALAAHNNARAAVGVGAMTWSSHLEA